MSAAHDRIRAKEEIEVAKVIVGSIGEEQQVGRGQNGLFAEKDLAEGRHVFLRVAREGANATVSPEGEHVVVLLLGLSINVADFAFTEIEELPQHYIARAPDGLGKPAVSVGGLLHGFESL